MARAMNRKPTHPGEIIKVDYMIPLKLTVTALAENLGISRKALSGIINQRAGVTMDMALRLARAFNTSPGLWLNLQIHHDLWMAEQNPGDWIQVRPLLDQRA